MEKPQKKQNKAKKTPTEATAKYSISVGKKKSLVFRFTWLKKLMKC